MTRHPRAASALVALMCAVTFGLVYVVADLTGPGQWADERLFRVLYGQVPGGLTDGMAFLARDLILVVLAAAAAFLALVAVWRRQWVVVVRVSLTTAVAVIATPWLRDDVLTRHPFIVKTFALNSMPSTHASAAAALVVAVVLLWPARRPWWLLNTGGVLLTLVALGNIVGQAHRPSDVAGSYLLVAGLLAASYMVTGDRPVNNIRDQ